MCVLNDDVTIGSNVDLLSGRRQHGIEDPSRSAQDQSGGYQQIRVGPRAWIGNSAVIMANIGDAAVVGAGSVVVRSIPAYVVAVGNPAVVKRTRAAACFIS